MFPNQCITEGTEYRRIDHDNAVAGKTPKTALYWFGIPRGWAFHAPKVSRRPGMGGVAARAQGRWGGRKVYKAEYGNYGGHRFWALSGHSQVWCWIWASCNSSSAARSWMVSDGIWCLLKYFPATPGDRQAGGKLGQALVCITFAARKGAPKIE